MRTFHRFSVFMLLALVLLAGCAAPRQQRWTDEVSAAPRQAEAPRTTGPKKITVAIMDVPRTLSRTINVSGSGSARGVTEMEELYTSGLSTLNDRSLPVARLAEGVPTLENGLWQLLPDGTMETTWRIRPGAKWHDLAPITADDLVFTAQVGMDPGVGALKHAGFAFVESLRAVDERTVAVRWNRTYLGADTMFSGEFAVPLPKHLLEKGYREDKAAFAQLPYWTKDFVGSGPFKLKQFEGSTFMTLQAFEEYVLGRPKLDEVEVRFIPDPNALIANLLAGEVEMTLGRGISPEQGFELRQQWQAGHVDMVPVNWSGLYPQFINPNPAALADVQFRRALLHAIDRQQIVDVFLGGGTAIAHSIVDPNDPAYKDVQGSIIKYDFDPRRTAQIVESFGYARGRDGFYRDAAGERLTIENRTTAGDDLREKTIFSIADYWQRVGIASESVIIPRQQASDREYRNTRPAFELVRQPRDLDRFRLSETPLPENRFVGNNRTRYMNRDLDTLIDRYFLTVPIRERNQLLAQIAGHMSDQLVVLGLYYPIEPTMIGNRIRNASAPPGDLPNPTWNAFDWDLQ